jgi:hypothetical protein
MKDYNTGEAGASSLQSDVSNDDLIIEAMGRISKGRELEGLSFLAAQLQAEQSHYWSRFAALAAIHAGLLVVTISEEIWVKLVMAVLGFLLAVVWIVIQKRSRRYVEYWKPAFHSYRRSLGLLLKDEELEKTKTTWSSTKVASVVPWVLLGPWIIIAVVAISKL